MCGVEISLLIAAFNEEKYIGQCIESAINQDFDKYEIIIVNDGSTDKTDEICRKYADSCQRIRYFSTTKSGISAARNYALSKSIGTYIAFADADDVFDRQYLSFMYGLIRKYEADLVINDCFRGLRTNVLKPYICEDSTIYGWKPLLCLKFKKYYPQHQAYAKLFKRELIEKVKFWEGHVVEDYYAFPEYCYYSDKIVYNRSMLYLYCLDKTESIMRKEKSCAFLIDQLVANKHWVTFFQDKDRDVYNLSIKGYLERLFMTYGEILNNLKVSGDRDKLKSFIESELKDTYRLFTNEVKSLDDVSSFRLNVLIKPKYFFMMHLPLLVKLRYRDMA